MKYKSLQTSHLPARCRCPTWSHLSTPNSDPSANCSLTGIHPDDLLRAQASGVGRHPTACLLSCPDTEPCSRLGPSGYRVCDQCARVGSGGSLAEVAQPSVPWDAAYLTQPLDSEMTAICRCGWKIFLYKMMKQRRREMKAMLKNLTATHDRIRVCVQTRPSGSRVWVPTASQHLLSPQ